MDEEITIIDTKNRNEKIKNFFVKNKKLLILITVILILTLLGFYSFQKYKDGHREWLANKYNSAVIKYERGDKSEVILSMKEIIEDKDNTYSPLGLYFLIDNNLIENHEQGNDFFDVLINELNLEKEIKNLLIYKKALYNSNLINENELIKMLNPIISSKSVWKSHGLYLLAEYFYSKNEKQKAKEFFDKILILPNSNKDIREESQKRINRDLSE
jgi:predicted negative regulator of RcsB-dependent stress response